MSSDLKLHREGLHRRSLPETNRQKESFKTRNAAARSASDSPAVPRTSAIRS